VATALAICATAWVSLIAWSPAGLAYPTTGSGTLARLVYRAGAGVCHQRPDRSFWRAGHPLPVCGRCYGLYVGGALGLLAAVGVRPRRQSSGRGYRRLLLAAAAPSLLVVAAEWSGLVAVGNGARAVSAMPLGGVAGWMVGVAALTMRTETRPTSAVR
jgi:hypothetical protein